MGLKNKCKFQNLGAGVILMLFKLNIPILLWIPEDLSA